jgi:hypothetical protein
MGVFLQIGKSCAKTSIGFKMENHMSMYDITEYKLSIVTISSFEFF